MTSAALVVNRPNVLLLPIWLLIGFVGVSAFAYGGLDGASIAIGAFMTGIFLLGLVHLTTTRVVVDGAELRVRRFGRWTEPVRLDRLVDAELTGLSRSRGRVLRLADMDGRRVEVDATNFSLRRLWEVLAVVLPATGTRGPRPGDRLERVLERHRSVTPTWRLPRTPPPQPAPVRHVTVLRARTTWWVLGTLALVLGLLALAAPDPEVAGSLASVVVGLVVLVACVRLRTTLEDDVLRERRLVGRGARVDLRRLRAAGCARSPLGRVLVLADEAGAEVRLHALTRDLRPVLRRLRPYLDPPEPRSVEVDDALRDRFRLRA